MTHPSAPCAQRGVALALLLWIIAALSLMITGVISMSRTDVQLTSLHLEQARAQSVATGVAHLLMRDLEIARDAGQYSGQQIFTRAYELDGMAIRARAIPSSGLVSINLAAPELLTRLFRYTAGLPPGQARALAEAIERWRSGDDFDAMAATEVSRLFEVEEDLLRVPGMKREIFERILPAIHAEASGQQGVFAPAAPAPVLYLLAEGNQRVVDFIEKNRQDLPPGEAADYTDLDVAFLSESRGSAYRLEIDVRVSETRMFQQQIWVTLATGRHGLPWRINRVKPITTALTGPDTDSEEDTDAG